MSSTTLFNPAKNKKSKHPIILVHGALFNAEAWKGNFYEYFSEIGYDTYAISLSGHGENGNKVLLNLYGLEIYTNDVINLITSLEEKPIVIGHSMGGIVTQLVAQRVSLQAAVLLAAVPPYGILNSMTSSFFSNPISWGKFAASTLFPFWKFINTEAPEGIYTTPPSREVQMHVGRNIQRESIRAMLEMCLKDFAIKPEKVNFPMYHIGFRDDKIIFPEDVEKTAALYNHESKIFENMAHAFMFEPTWENVAKHVEEWLNNQ
ncbi:alpha/beta hydrolase [Flammeovirga pectinis]|uniref:Alpha/beta hydrolase n=1 Tax=Flammeovirga pectinis TaxID=2494373 RepID=A0A3S9P7Z2_9BACT|nr:alpha/beta hydrolase [Flammeovirga pectinis]AZQ64338.1 alpha/beta hydrolase [Flammeovirga pectinis]